MVNIKRLPTEIGVNGWSMNLPYRRPAPQLEGDQQFDWAVLGAGFTGFAAARRLAEARPGDSIALIDALEVGAGASGRNSGFAIDHAHSVGGGVADPESARAQKRLYGTALALLEELKDRYGIDCDWRKAGKFHAAASERGAQAYLKPLQAELASIGEDYKWLDRGQIRSELRLGHYEAAIYTPGTVLLNPAALVRGLADNLPDNVTLAEMTPVEEIIDGPNVTLSTTFGRVRAGQLILATNAWCDEHASGTRSLLPFAAFASLSRPLTATEQADLGGRATWGVTPANGFVAPTIQRTGDQRILFRDTIRYSPTLDVGEFQLDRMTARHDRRFRERFPMLARVELEATWGGFLCMTQNQDTAFGRAGENIWRAAGHQGIGITRGTIAGLLAADLAMGLDNPLIPDMMRIANPPAVPPQPFLSIGVYARTLWEAWKERDES